MIGVMKKIHFLILFLFLSSSIAVAKKKIDLPTSGELADFKIFDETFKVPDIPFQNSEGKEVTLQSFKGKVLVLNFWATWCPPCVREMPSLDKLQEELGGDNFEVVTLTFDRLGVKRINKFFEKFNLKNIMPYVDQQDQVAKAFDTFALPSTFLIDAEGNVLGKLSGPADWASEDALALIKPLLEDTKE